LGNAILGLLPPQEGRIRRAGGVAAHRFQKLYQDPVAAFAPRSTLGAALEDVCRLHGLAPGAAAPLLARLRIRPDLLLRHADQVSGGELQRIALARALIVDPVFVFADEPTSRLDPVIQSEVMGLLRELVDERRMAVLMVTHDDALAAGMTRKRISLVGLGPAGAQAKKS
jgi:peptide/nickel transport system ATP-binding protein